MALSAVLPDAALRVTRTAAGRRALQVALLVGGLFVLGLLCGEQARAADGVAPASKPTDVVRSVTSSVEQVANSGSARVSSFTTPPSAATAPSDSGSATASSSATATGSEQPRLRLPKAITPVTDEVQRVVRPVTEPVVRPVAEHVVRPVTERVIPPVAEDVVRPIGDLVDQIAGGVTGGIVERPAPPQWWPSLPQLLALPGLPGLPELPGLPLPAVPGQTLPVGTAPHQPAGATGDQRAAEKQSRDESAATVYGPRFAVGQIGRAHV